MRRSARVKFVGASLLVGSVLVGCASSPQPADTGFIPAPGEVLVNVAGHYGHPDRVTCDTLANVDLTGKRVTVNDGDGNIAALATLTDAGGRDLDWDDYALPSNFFQVNSGMCVWKFDIPAIEADSEYFTVTVEGVSSTQNVTRAELGAGLRLTAPAGPA